MAEEIARETDNAELLTVVMACRAFQAAYGAKDLTLGLDFAEAATAAAATGSSTVTRGRAAAVASERHADLGETAPRVFACSTKPGRRIGGGSR